MQLSVFDIKDTQYNVQYYVFFNIAHKSSHNFQSIHYYIMNLWEFCVFNHSLLASRKIGDPSPENNLSAKTK